jgi:hypothetical protein
VDRRWGGIEAEAVGDRPLRRDPSRLLMVASCLFLVVGSLLPWVSAFSDQVGLVQWSGVDGRGDGGILMFLGILLAVFGLWGVAISEAWAPLHFIPPALAVAILLDYVLAFRETNRLLEEGVGTGRLEIGLFVCGAGALLAVAAASFWVLEGRRPT